MKEKILTYLFIFSLLIIFFQFVNTKNNVESLNFTIQSSDKAIKKLKDSLKVLDDEIFQLSDFDYRFNAEARYYFDDNGIDSDSLMPILRDKLISLNEYKGEEHPLIPYASTTGRNIMINSIKMLNHKWIIADFSDGEYWGELLIKYNVINKNEIEFKTIDHLLYLE